MKPDLHPKWYPAAQVACACGNAWSVGATVPEIRTDVCSKCHPFYTGEQRIVDTEGQVDRFMRRLRAREEAIREAELRKDAKTSPDAEIESLGLSTRLTGLLAGADLTTAGDLISLLEEKGDDGLTAIKGVGLKALADTKRSLRTSGYVLPGDEPLAEEADAEAPAAEAA